MRYIVVSIDTPPQEIDRRCEELTALGAGGCMIESEDDFQGFRILTIGRLTQQKRYDIAIQAMALLKEKCQIPVRWYVLGEGDLRESLEQQIKAAHLEKDFILLGVISVLYVNFIPNTSKYCIISLNL